MHAIAYLQTVQQELVYLMPADSEILRTEKARVPILHGRYLGHISAKVHHQAWVLELCE